jgi:hypothetical protein
MESVAALTSVGLAIVHAASKVAARSVIGPRIDWASSRRAIGLVDLQNALGKLDRLIDLAVRQHRQEGAAEQLVVTRVTPERGAIVRRRGGGISLTASVSGGQIAAGRRDSGEIRGSLRPCREHCRPSDGECGHCGHGRTP